MKQLCLSLFRYRVILFATGAAALLLAHGSLSAGNPIEKRQAGKTNRYTKVEQIGAIADPSATEASGLAVSRCRPDRFWLVNDSGNPPVLHLLSSAGKDLGQYKVAQAQNIDWEDLAGFVLNGIPYLMIADVGDNRGQHTQGALYIIQEPACNASGSGGIDILFPEWTIQFQYEDGPRDCEAVAVDAPHNRVLLLSKRTTPPVLYELPLLTDPTRKKLTARKIVALTTIPPPSREDLQYRYGSCASQPTAMDLSPDGTTLFILTYTHIYQYQRRENETWAEALQNRPRIISCLPHPATGQLRQRESLAVHPLTGDLFITSEGEQAPIYRIGR